MATIVEPRILTVYSRIAPPFVDTRRFSSEHGIPAVVELIEKNARHQEHVPFYDSLSSCEIGAVWHLRSEKTKHEIVIVRYTLSLESGSDTRFARFERFRLPSDPRRNQKTVRSSEDMKQLLETAARLDSMRISDSMDDLTHGHYAVVQTLSAIPSGTFDVLDVVALSQVVGDTACHYSVLRHMCQWYAAALFKLLRARVPDKVDTYKRGPAYDRAGTARFSGMVVRLVDVESAALLWPARDATAKDFEGIAQEVFYQHGLPADELRDDIQRAIARDAARLLTNPPVLTTIQTAADTLIPELRATIKEHAEKAAEIVGLAKRTLEAEAKAQSEENKRLQAEAELAKANALIAQLMQRTGMGAASPPLDAM